MTHDESISSSISNEKASLCEQLRDAIGDNASYEMVFDRKPDNSGSYTYVIEINQLNSASPHGSGSDINQALISKREVLPLIPNGNKWESALSWTSYYVIPFPAQGTDWVGIGTEKVFPDPERIAAPFSFGYIFPFNGKDEKSCEMVSQSINSLADAIANLKKPQLVKLDNFGDISRPIQDISIDVEMLRHAARQYKNGQKFFLRTLLLEDMMHPQRILEVFKLPPPYSSLYKDRNYYLVGKSDKSSSDNSWLQLIEFFQDCFKGMQYRHSDNNRNPHP